MCANMKYTASLRYSGVSYLRRHYYIKCSQGKLFKEKVSILVIC